MPRLSSLLVAAALAGAAPLASATHWICQLDDRLVDLVCVADVDPQLPVAHADATTAVVRGVAFPLDPSLAYRVPLWTPPSDPAFVEQLAEATLCYRSPGCTVQMGGAAWAALSAPRVVAMRSHRRR